MLVEQDSYQNILDLRARRNRKIRNGFLAMQAVPTVVFTALFGPVGAAKSLLMAPITASGAAVEPYLDYRRDLREQLGITPKQARQIVHERRQLQEPPK